MTRQPLLLGVLIATFSPATALAEREEPPPAASRLADGPSVGLSLHRFQDDFAVGALVGTPTFVHDMFRLTLGGGVAFFANGVDSSGQRTWTPYGHGRLVLETGRTLETIPVRLYAFAGSQLLLLPSAISSDTVGVGGIGGFGFEFYFAHPDQAPHQAFFIELGAMGTAATASNQPGNPSIENGFVTNAGVRWFP